MTKVRTRIAPSPTGFLHLGTARTALFSWAYARHHGGDFILRIEDTDVARSNQTSVDQIIAAMQWLQLGYDEGPFYQMQRIARYQEVIAQMLAAGTAYHCYCSTGELDAMRERQRAAALPIRYDGTWRPEPGKTLPPSPTLVPPVVRFRSPQTGEVAWTDLVKGPISFNNQELDDLIIARAPQDESSIGVPTYNFCVVVDDWDMGITHVIRGDDHVNNTPRQINILQALGAPLPQYGHTPMILGPDGDKLSKRHGAVSVLQYEELGYLPEALVNYLARLGWSHGDDELFTPEQLVAWFDTDHLTKSAAQWDVKKLDWVNAHHIKQCAPERLSALVAAQLAKRGISADARLSDICALFKDRCATTVELATWAAAVYNAPEIDAAERAQHITAPVKIALELLAKELEAVDWSKSAISDAIKKVVLASGLKMPQLAMPARLLLTGRAQAPSLDALLVLFSRNDALVRLRGH